MQPTQGAAVWKRKLTQIALTFDRTIRRMLGKELKQGEKSNQHRGKLGDLKEVLGMNGYPKAFIRHAAAVKTPKDKPKDDSHEYIKGY